MEESPVLRRVRSADGAVTLATYDYGGAGRDCLLVHGNGLHALAYDPLARVLRAAGLRVVALDQRGMGASSTLPEAGCDLRWAAFGADVLAVHRALGLKHCLGFGHSLGGAALLLAEASCPGAFASLYLYEPVVAPAGEPGQPHEWEQPLSGKVQAARRRRASFPCRADALAAYAQKLPLSLLHPSCLRLYVERGFRDTPPGGSSVTLCCLPETEATVFELGPSAGVEALLPRISCPVTVAQGGRDAHDGPARVAPTVATRVVRGVLQLHPKLGHFGPLEDPEGVAGCALASFYSATSRL